MKGLTSQLNFFTKALGMPSLDEMIKESVDNLIEEKKTKESELFDDDEWNKIHGRT